MAKWRTGIALVGLWACLGVKAQSQGPGYAPGQPLPIGPAASPQSKVIVGPLRARDVPPGPDEALGLPPKGPNAFGGEHHQDYDFEIQGGLRTAGGVILLNPHFKSATALAVEAGTASSQADFDFQNKVAPWFEVEYLFDFGWGVRARGFVYHNAAPTVFHVNYPGVTQSVNALPFAGAPVPDPLFVSPILVPGTTPIVRSSAPVPGFQVNSPNVNNIIPVLPDTVVGGLFRTFRLFAPATTIPDSLLGAGIGMDVFQAGAKLNLDVVNLEATRYVSYDSWQFMAAAGLRYASITQSYRVTRTNPAAGSRFEVEVYNPDEPDPLAPPDFDPAQIFYDQDFSVLDYVRKFDGMGPSVLFEARLPFADTGVSFFGNARTSFLVGRRREDAFTAKVIQGRLGICPTNGEPLDGPTCAQFPGPVFFPFTFIQEQYASASSTRIMPVFEFELGGEWDFDSGSPHFLFQAAFVNQYWVGAGKPTGANGTLALFGLKLMAGMQF